MNEYQEQSAAQIAEIAEAINNRLPTVFKNNSKMVAKLAIAIFMASQIDERANREQ